MLFAAPTGKDNLTVSVIQLIGILFRALLANRAALAMENLALRQQLAVLEWSVKRPALGPR